MYNLKNTNFHRIPHLSSLSNIGEGDLIESNLIFPLNCHIQEKVDGANVGMSFIDGEPFLRNRRHVLKKSFEPKTNAKRQFQGAWHWLHSHKSDFLKIERQLGKVVVFGEWLQYQHSIFYDQLPDLFLAYDIMELETGLFFSPSVVEDVLSETRIHFISSLEAICSWDDILRYTSEKSQYRDGNREGIVIKQTSGQYQSHCFKFVNSWFVPRDDFNTDLKKNIVK